MTSDVLSYESPETEVALIPNATIGEDGNLYHIGRYAPHGLYGGADPAEREYNGVALKERCRLLEDKNTALAVRVELNGAYL